MIKSSCSFIYGKYNPKSKTLQVLYLGCSHPLWMVAAEKNISKGYIVGADIWNQIDQMINAAQNTLKRSAKMRKILLFDLAKSVATYRNAFRKLVAQTPSPVFTEEMRSKQQEAIDSAKVVYKLTTEDHTILSEILEQAKNSTPY